MNRFSGSVQKRIGFAVLSSATGPVNRRIRAIIAVKFCLFMRRNVLIRYGLLLLMVLLTGFLLFPPQLLRCLFVDRSADFRLLGGNTSIYVSRTASPAQITYLRQNLKTAQDRISRFWGDKRGETTLIYCPAQAHYEQYCDGGDGAGCSLGMPWGTTYLILGPGGNNADVIAHELCHNELFTRIGWWRVKRQIPQWFNEGLALMVDYRFSSPSVWESPDSLRTTVPGRLETIPWPPRPLLKLSELETTLDFFGGDQLHTMMAYETAANEVARWLSVVGRDGIPTLTNEVAAGKTFSNTYHRLERKQRPKKKRSLRNKPYIEG